MGAIARSAVLAAAAAIGLACGGESTTAAPDGGDAAQPPGLVDTWPDPLAAAAPMPTSLGPCPSGWREVTRGDGAITCDPGTHDGEVCPDGQIWLPGAEDCTPLGAPCPTDGFGGYPGDRLFFVLAGAQDGDGSRERPFGSIAEAVTGAAVHLVVGPGTYDESVNIVEQQVTIEGVCPEQVILETDTGVRVFDGQLTLQNLTLRTTGPGVVLSRSEADLTGIHFAQYGGQAIDAQASRVTGRRLRFEPETALRQPATLALSASSDAQLSEVMIAGTAGTGIEAFGAFTSLELEDSVIQDTSDSLTSLGRGIEAYGARIDLRRTLFDRTNDAAVAAFEGTQLLLRDVVVRDTRATDDDLAGRGLVISSDSDVVATRLYVTGSRELGIAVSDSGAELRDVVIADTRPLSSDETAGIGLAAERSSLMADHLHVAGARTAGILIDGASRARMRNGVVSAVTGRASDGRFGTGISLQRSSDMAVDGLEVRDTRQIALLASDSSLEAQNLWIHGVEEERATQQWGYGLAAQSGASVRVQRTEISDARGVGMAAFDDAEVTGSDLLVTNTRSLTCAESSCVEASLGFGLGIYGGASLRAERFIVRESVLCGVHAALGGQFELEEGLIDGAQFGLCLEGSVDDVDLDQQAVRVRATGASVSAIQLPVPGAASPLNSDG